ncbi:MAG: amino acid permease [Polyangiaceae bacterium]|nr:amino acid permease [Polyangiaceae bacterium]
MSERQNLEQVIQEDVKQLHGMGYAQELLRRMSGFSNFAISFSIICILAGGITSFHLALSATGGGGVGVGWAVGTLLTLVVAACMAQIASAYPTAGGLYHWASILGGRGWGWGAAWLNLAGLVFVVAAVNIGAYTIMMATFGPIFGFDPAKLGVKEQIIGMVLITTSQALLNHFGIRLTSLLTDFSGYLIFAVSTLLTVCMLWFGESHDLGRLTTFTNMSGDAGAGVWPQSGSLVGLFLLGLLLPAYTITGYDASAHTSEETIGAAHNVPKGILRSVLYSGIFGWVMVCSFVLAMPSVAEGAAQGGNAFFWLMDTIMPPTLKIVLEVLISVSNYLCGLACVTSTSRMMFAFARDGGLPGSKLLRQVHAGHRTPVPAIWCTAVLAIAATVYSPAYVTLTSACVIFLYISYAMPTAVGVFVIGKKWDRMGPFNMGIPAFRALGVIAVLFVAALFFIGIQPPNDKALYVTAGMIALLVVAWFAGVRSRFQGPPTGKRIEELQAELAREEQVLEKAS